MATDVHYQPHFLAGLIAALRLGVPVYAGAPGAPTDGDVWIDSTGPAISFRSGGATTTIAAGMTTEAVQDVVGAFLTDSGLIDFTYDDAGNTETATLIDGSVTNAKLTNEAAATIKGRASGAGSGAPTDLTAAQVKTILAIASADISDFTEAAQDAVGAALTDTATVDFTYNDGANTITASVLDSPTVNGKSAAQIQSDTIAAIVAGASSAYDTLVEIQALLQADDTALSGLTTAVGLRARRYAADLTGGATTENVDHNLALANNGDFIAKVYVKASGVEEVYRIDGATTNRVVITDETGSNIPAGRRIFLVAL